MESVRDFMCHTLDSYEVVFSLGQNDLAMGGVDKGDRPDKRYLYHRPLSEHDSIDEVEAVSVG